MDLPHSNGSSSLKRVFPIQMVMFQLYLRPAYIIGFEFISELGYHIIPMYGKDHVKTHNLTPLHFHITYSLCALRNTYAELKPWLILCCSCMNFLFPLAHMYLDKILIVIVIIITLIIHNHSNDVEENDNNRSNNNNSLVLRHFHNRSNNDDDYRNNKQKSGFQSFLVCQIVFVSPNFCQWLKIITFICLGMRVLYYKLISDIFSCHFDAV